MESELKRLLEEKERVEAISKSAAEAEKKFAEDVQSFFVTHLGIPKGAQVNIIEVVKRAREAK